MGEAQRVKREDCSELKNGPDFSPWKVLVGPSDWEDHSSGVCGAERYRTHNLPLGCMGPGLYELGIAMTSTESGQRVRDPNPRYVITVYVGVADKVRTRLQEYGRNGSHLDGGKSINLPDENKGPGLFQDVFSKGFSIVCRWVPMRRKREAEDTEAKLLKRFDYAWNRGGNGARRPHDITPMLDTNKIIFRKNRSCDTLTKCRASSLQINGRIPSEDSEAGTSYLKLLHGLQATVLSRSRPQLVSRRFAVHELYICGAMMGNGLSCTNRPIEGNKRCIDHKGQRVHGSFSICGMILEDGSTCKSSAVDGRKRCEHHKGERIPTGWLVDTKIASNCPIPDFTLPLVKYTDHKERLPCSFSKSVGQDGSSSTICGMILEDGSICKSFPVDGRKRCELHKGERISTGWLIDTKIVSNRPIPDFTLPLVKYNDHKERLPCSFFESVGEDCSSSSTCGMILEDGSICKNSPVPGRKRCELHKGERIPSRPSVDAKTTSKHPISDFILPSVKADPLPSQPISKNHPADEDYNRCEVDLGDGRFCTRLPVQGRKRCEEHKGWRVTTNVSSVPSCWNRSADEDDNRCGVDLGDGRFCMRFPVQGRKRCEEHKGRRVTTSASFEPKTACDGYRSWNYCTSKSQQQPRPCTRLIDSAYEENYDTCGVSIGNGLYCRNRPPSGRKRCDEHKGQRIYGSYSSTIMADYSGFYGGFSDVCGATMRNGSICMSSPAPGRKRCGRHKGMRA